MMNEKSVYLLAFAPHPHDFDLTMGGTAARLVKEGKDIILVVCTNGDKGLSDPKYSAVELAKTREQEQRESAKIIGVREVIFLRHPDLGLEYTPGFRKEVLKLILTYRPQIVATRDPYQQRYVSNPDHRAVGRAVMDACWPCAQATNGIRDLIEQGLNIHKVQEVWLWTPEQPNHRSDVSETIDIKLKAMACHKTMRVDVPPAPDHEDKQKEQHRVRAEGTDYKYAELFVRVKIPQRL
jgi:LmbE family N-acetylglucosaminyl deacetylase